jgi:DNA-binding LytR/AlgR family response regulator
MKIAICDDEDADLQILAQYCRNYDEALPLVCFHSGKELLQGFQQTFYDIVFLDIEMGSPNGYETAVQLVSGAQKPIIVFTTQNLSYAVRGYGIAIKYLPKPIGYDVFLPALQLALEKAMPKRIAVPFEGDTKLLDVSQILYIEVYRHKIYIHMSDGTVVPKRGALAEMMEQVGGAKFIQIHKSYCINPDYIDRVNVQEVILTNGEKVPISRHRKEAFNRQLNAYLKGSPL